MNSFLIFLALIIIIAFLLIVVIMVQNPKGGGLSSSFGGGGTQQIGGVKQTSDFLDKSTWFLATALVVLIILASTFGIQNNATSESKAYDKNEVRDELPPAPSSNPLPKKDPNK